MIKGFNRDCDRFKKKDVCLNILIMGFCILMVKYIWNWKKCLYILIIVRIFKKFIMGLNIVIVLFGRININFILEECDLFEINSIENICVMED